MCDPWKDYFWNILETLGFQYYFKVTIKYDCQEGFKRNKMWSNVQLLKKNVKETGSCYIVSFHTIHQTTIVLLQSGKKIWFAFDILRWWKYNVNISPKMKIFTDQNFADKVTKCILKVKPLFFLFYLEVNHLTDRPSETSRNLHFLMYLTHFYTYIVRNSLGRTRTTLKRR